MSSFFGNLLAGGGIFNQFDSQGNIRDKIEDLSIAVLLLISASGSLTVEAWKKFSPWFLARFGVPTGDQLVETLSNTLLFGPEVAPLFVSKTKRRAMNSFAIALFAEQILSRLGVRTATSRIMERVAAEKLTGTHIVKSGRAGARLKWISATAPTGEYARANAWATSIEGEFALVSDIVPEAASIDYIRRVVLSLKETFDVRDVFSIETENLSIAIRESQVWRLVGEVSKSCGMADKLFVAFTPTEAEMPEIRRAIHWNSPAYLRIHAARTLLSLTTAHFSNVLTTRDARLFSIDNDTGYFEGGEDIEMLFCNVRRLTEVRKILDDIADALTERDIRDAIAALPQHPAVGPTEELESYFVERLRLWRKLADRTDKTDLQAEPVATSAVAAV